jgi:hypothetical protein
VYVDLDQAEEILIWLGVSKVLHRFFSPDAKVVFNVRYFKFKNEFDAWRSVDVLQIRIKFDGEDLPWL